MCLVAAAAAAAAAAASEYLEDSSDFVILLCSWKLLESSWMRCSRVRGKFEKSAFPFSRFILWRRRRRRRRQQRSERSERSKRSERSGLTLRKRDPWISRKLP